MTFLLEYFKWTHYYGNCSLKDFCHVFSISSYFLLYNSMVSTLILLYFGKHFIQWVSHLHINFQLIPQNGLPDWGKTL